MTTHSTALNNQPANLNFLPTNNIQFGIKKAPNLSFFCQEANIPDISLPPVNIPNPFVNTPQYGDHIEFDPLTIKFRVDELMANYMEIHNWMRGTGFASNHEEFAAIQNIPKTLGMGLFSDVELTIFDAVKNPRFSVTFIDAFPISLSGITFRSTNTDAMYAESTAVFRYTLYNITSIV